MNRKSRPILLMLAAFVPAFAGIDGTMAPGIDTRELCVVDLPDGANEFRNAMVKSLRTRGYDVRWVTERGACDVSMAWNATYGMTSGWGVRRVLKSAAMVVYRDSQAIGSAHFRYEKSMFGGGSDGSVEEVISQMVFKMLPPAP